MGTGFELPKFEIFANPSVMEDTFHPMDQEERFRLQTNNKEAIELIDNSLNNDIYAQEIANVLECASCSAEVENTAIDLGEILHPNDVLNIIEQIIRWDLSVAKILVNHKELIEMLKWNSPLSSKLTLPMIDSSSGKDGYAGTFVNVPVWSSKIVPPGTMYALSMPENVGVLIRDDDHIFIADEYSKDEPPVLLKYGWVIDRKVQMAVTHPKGVAIGRKPRKD